MVWRGSPKGQDKLYACLVYLIPILEVLRFGVLLFILVPPLAVLAIPLFSLYSIYHWGVGGIPIVSFAIFLLVYAKVVNNRSLIHFLRYNAMQALVLAVFTWLCTLVLELFGISQEILLSMVAGSSQSFGSISSLVSLAIVTILFIVVMGASLYSIFQCTRGMYAEMPVISDTAYSQVR